MQPATLICINRCLAEMDDHKIVLISSVRPEPTSGGQVILHRHFVERGGFSLEIFGAEPERLSATSSIRKSIGQLTRTPFHRVAEDFWVMWHGRWLDEHLPAKNGVVGKGVVVTVAHGDACMAALRYAKRQNMPLVTFFHDWWPDIPSVHTPFRSRLEDDFRRLYRDSSVALCVSDGMRAALGDHPCAPVLYPISSRRKVYTNEPPRKSDGVFAVQYFGNLGDYGPMLGNALREFLGHKVLRLEVRGDNPRWNSDFKQQMKAEGYWKPFVPRQELDDWLCEADAFLIPMVFNAALHRRMETSFPSKLVEFAQWGKPLVVWGPEYCSAVKWARRGDLALCVTDPDPVVLRRALEALAHSPGERERLSASAQHVARTEFDPDKIQNQFLEALRQAGEMYSTANRHAAR